MSRDPEDDATAEIYAVTVRGYGDAVVGDGVIAVYRSNCARCRQMTQERDFLVGELGYLKDQLAQARLEIDELRAELDMLHTHRAE